MDNKDSATRLRILQVALKRFAHAGYAGVSVQDIVDDAKVTKPTLYYYFGSKAGLYKALVDHAHDERFRLMQEAAGRGKTFPEQLTDILTALFDFLGKNKDLMRLTWATAFAAPGEVPQQASSMKKGMRNFTFLQDFIEKEVAVGRMNNAFDSKELTMALYGMVNMYVIGALLGTMVLKRSRQTAEKIVKLYFEGAKSAATRSS
ncbi:MAG: TetR family transcriptional regulator [Verrucomicrobiales bacterium]|nr:TetR family transcriptional regulator [Verrucomicrobiales bacterium]